METAPQIGTHNACASGKTTGEGNRIRFPKQIQGDARVAEYAVGIRIIYRDIGLVDSAMQPDEQQPKILPPLSEVIPFPA